MFGASQKCFRRMEFSILFMGKAFPDPHGKWTRFLNFQISSFLSKLGILIRYYFLSHGKGTRFVSDTHVAPSLIKISFRKNIFFLPPPPFNPHTNCGALSIEDARDYECNSLAGVRSIFFIIGQRIAIGASQIFSSINRQIFKL